MTKANLQLNHSATVKSWLAASLFSVALVSAGVVDSDNAHAATWIYDPTNQTLPSATTRVANQSNATATASSTEQNSQQTSNAQEIVRVNLTYNGSFISQTILNAPYETAITDQELNNPQALLAKVSVSALNDYLNILNSEQFKDQNVVGKVSISGSQTNATLTVDLSASTQPQTTTQYISPADVTDGSLSTTQILSISGFNQTVSIWWVEEKMNNGSTNYLAFLSLDDANTYAREMTATGKTTISPESGLQYDGSLTIGDPSSTNNPTTDNGDTTATISNDSTGSTTTTNTNQTTSTSQPEGTGQTTDTSPTDETQTKPSTPTKETTKPSQPDDGNKATNSNQTSNEGTQPSGKPTDADQPIRQVSVEYVNAKTGKILTSEILTGSLNTAINFDTQAFVQQYFHNNYIVLKDETRFGGQFDLTHSIYTVSVQQVNSQQKAKLQHSSMPSIQKFAELFPTKKASVQAAEKSASNAPVTNSQIATTQNTPQSNSPQISHQPNQPADVTDHDQNTQKKQSKKQNMPTWKKSPLSSLNVVNNPQSGAVAFGNDPDEFTTLARYFISISGKINLGSK